jgi:hypothetical protein
MELVLTQNFNMKKVIYTVVNIIIYIILIGPVPRIVANYTNSEFVFWFLEIIMLYVCISTAYGSFHQIKRSTHALAFVFGEYIGSLSEGTSFVPGGFLKGSVQKYTKSDILLEKKLKVIKLKDKEEKYSYSIVGSDGIEKVVEYELMIDVTSSLFIKKPEKFFETSGLLELKEDDPKVKELSFFKTITMDLFSDIDTIAADYGYIRFRKKTDWTAEELVSVSRKIMEKDISLEPSKNTLLDTLEFYGLGVRKITTVTDFDPVTKQTLSDQLRADAERGPLMSRANNNKEAAEKAAEAEAYGIKKTKEADAYAEALKVCTVGAATTRAVAKSIDTYLKITDEYGNRYSLDAAKLQAALDNGSYSNENLNVIAGANGETVSGLLMSSGVAKGKDSFAILAALAEKYGFTDKLDGFFENLSKKSDAEKLAFLKETLTTK